MKSLEMFQKKVHKPYLMASPHGEDMNSLEMFKKNNTLWIWNLKNVWPLKSFKASHNLKEKQLPGTSNPAINLNTSIHPYLSSQ